MSGAPGTSGPSGAAHGPSHGPSHGREFDGLDLTRAPGDAPVAFGGALGPDALLAAYRRGLFPMPAADEVASAFNEARFEEAVAAGEVVLLPGTASPEEDPYALAWWSPDPRPVIAPDGVRIGSRLSRRLRNGLHWWTSADRAFERVVDACADGREPAWLTPELREALSSLHDCGAAHSAEVWEGEELIGGVFGVRAGPVLSLDSMFHRRPDAARVAVADLAARFGAAGGRLLDAQWDTPHVRALGAVPVERRRYLAELAAPADDVRPPAPDALPAARLSRSGGGNGGRHGGGHRGRTGGPDGGAGRRRRRR
ncbi:leucyl/phenylalanyl-tRNA--protein transferase [Kitasatospora sp. CM 4170]|uniref:Leucyl/phenylalanyl-tRNA--protein transferase n=1 Tax=Kitasatospora aburaviensis TaxID=67265 RepID=A0ABW1ENM8_9ACTN|nr:leucyl/phenylalanyl-tRNA--protein transferase [Kitasatospora sp. CM 4170]WNM48390.1 leucyl/phenylalanyl-tRNA--protein transferase [Kitasatospora sp. CM 4170]